MIKYDVIIIGLGTGGAYLAYLLSKSGLKVLGVEMRSIDKVYKYTGDAIGKHHIDNLKIEIPSKVIVNKYEGVEIYSPDLSTKYIVKGEGYSLDIYEWQQWLIKIAINAGTTVLDRHKAIAPIIENDKVIGVKILSENGELREIYGKIIVDATGPSACIRTKLPSEWLISEPLKPEDASYAYREIIEIEDRIENPQYIKIYISNTIAPGGYWWFFPKGRYVVNVGLGIWGKYVKENNYQPIHFYNKFIKLKFKVVETLSRGGGIVPTRRPIKSLVSSGILTIGDAGFTVNPIHGGGLGPTLLAAKLAANTIIKAFEKGDYSINSLWKLNIDYLKEYGIKQYKLDLFRLMLQSLTDNEISKGMKLKIVNEDQVLDLSSSGKTTLNTTMKIKLLVKSLKIPNLLSKLLTTYRYMRKIENICKDYPSTFQKFEPWYLKLSLTYNEFLKSLNIPIPPI